MRPWQFRGCRCRKLDRGTARRRGPNIGGVRTSRWLPMRIPWSPPRKRGSRAANGGEGRDACRTRAQLPRGCEHDFVPHDVEESDLASRPLHGFQQLPSRQSRSDGTGFLGSQMTSAAPPLDGSTTPSPWVPLWRIIEWIASAIGDSRELEHYARTRLCIRQAALDGRLRIRGRHEIERVGQDQTNFSEVYSEIPSAYWKHSVINALATGATSEGGRHTNPETAIPGGQRVFMRQTVMRGYSSTRMMFSS
jgi:hypothetical protein